MQPARKYRERAAQAREQRARAGAATRHFRAVQDTGAARIAELESDAQRAPEVIESAARACARLDPMIPALDNLARLQQRLLDVEKKRARIEASLEPRAFKSTTSKSRRDADKAKRYRAKCEDRQRRLDRAHDRNATELQNAARDGAPDRPTVHAREWRDRIIVDPRTVD